MSPILQVRNEEESLTHSESVLSFRKVLGSQALFPTLSLLTTFGK